MQDRSKPVVRKMRSASGADFDEQLWPINVAILIMVAFIAGMVMATSDFSEPRLIFNGWVHLAGVALLGGVLFWSVMLLQNRMGRRFQLCVVLSLLVHILLSLYLHEQYLALLAQREAEHEKQMEDERKPVTVPDYFPEQLEQPEKPQNFERPVETEQPEPEEPKQPEREPLEHEPIPEQKPAPEPQTQRLKQPSPAELRRAELTAPRRADEAAGAQISRQPWKHRHEPNEPVPQPEIRPSRERAPANPDAAVGQIRRRETERPSFQRKAFEQPTATRAEDVARMARRARREQPTQEQPATAQPTRQLAPAEVARTEAATPEPTPAVKPPEPLDREPEVSLARRRLETPTVRKANAEPTPNLPEATARSVQNRRPNRQQPELAQAPRSQPQRRLQQAALPESQLQPPPQPASQKSPQADMQPQRLAVSRQAVRPAPRAAPTEAPGESAATTPTVVPRNRRPAAQMSQQMTPKVEARGATRLARRASSVREVAPERVEGPAIARHNAAAKSPQAEPQPGSTEIAKADSPAINLPQPSDGGPTLPRMTRAAQLPSAAARRAQASAVEPAADQAAAARPGSLARAVGGVPLPSAAQPAARPAVAAAASGASRPSAMEPSGNTAVTRTESSKAPSASSTAAAGVADFAVGSTEIVSRAGQPRAAGAEQPSMQSNSPAARLARAQGSGASITAAPLPVEAPEASTTAEMATPGGPTAPAANAAATAATRGGSQALPVATVAAGSGPEEAVGTPGRIGAASLARVTRHESMPSDVAGGGTPKPARSLGRAEMPQTDADAPQVAAAATPGGRQAGSPVEARVGGQQRQIAGLPGSVTSQPAAGAAAALASDARPLPGAAARRAEASQRDGQPGDLAPDTSATIARTDPGASLPAAATEVAEAPGLGAAGLATTQGGMPSRLEAGEVASVQRASAAMPRGEVVQAAGRVESAVGGAVEVALAGKMRSADRGMPDLAADAPAGRIGRSQTGGMQLGGAADAAEQASPGTAETAMQTEAGGAPQPAPQVEAVALARGQGTGLPAGGLAAQPGPAAANDGAAGAVAAASLSRRSGSQDAPQMLSGQGVTGPTRQLGRAAAADLVAELPQMEAAGADAGGQETAAVEPSPDGRVVGQQRQASGLPGELVRQMPVDTAAQTGQAGANAGEVAGPQRVAQADDDAPSLAAEIGGATLDRKAAPGLPTALAEIEEAQPVGAAGAPGEAEPLDSAVAGTGTGQPARQAGGLPVQIAAAPGPGGLSFAPSPEVGIPSRRARPESDVIHTVSRRFVIERSGGELAIDGHVRQEPTEAYRQRDPGKREDMARQYGGGKGTEEAVERGLDFFARFQFPDGHWSLHEITDTAADVMLEADTPAEQLVARARPYYDQGERLPIDQQGEGRQRGRRLELILARFDNGRELSGEERSLLAAFIRQNDFGIGQMHSDTAATGLALLSYLGAGYTHLDDKHRAVVRRGLDWLAQHQKPNGDLFTGGAPYAWFYSHGIATIALCEGYGMTRDPELREPAQRAIQFIVDSQHPTRGGWRYKPNQETDTSVSGWQLMALKSAQMAGLDVPQETLDKVEDWLDLAQHAGGSKYAYNPYASNSPEQRSGRVPNLAMTSEGLLMRMYLGWDRRNPALVEGADFLKDNLPEVGTEARSRRDVYYWYYATQVMFQMQGEHWDAWHDRLKPLLQSSQADRGPLAGSWHPDRPTRDRWGHTGGRMYITAMNLLMLEVYYRHLPLFQTLRK